jgi:hypothetical protein
LSISWFIQSVIVFIKRRASVNQGQVNEMIKCVLKIEAIEALHKDERFVPCVIARVLNVEISEIKEVIRNFKDAEKASLKG